jgi:hypothetical protein
MGRVQAKDQAHFKRIASDNKLVRGMTLGVKKKIEQGASLQAVAEELPDDSRKALLN